jgi:hypothetical protein
MPTPFQHLVYARRVLNNPALPEEVRQVLTTHRSAFLFGSTAGDVQAVTGQPRYETHFYHFPPELSAPRAATKMLETYPQLADPAELSPEHAAFISGYLVHLSWDEFWAWDVFIPFYRELRLWPNRLTRSVHHNALRVTMDRRAEAELRAWSEIVPLLKAAQPRAWLPFVADSSLGRWRDWLVEQLEDPAKVQTVQVFAERMGVSVADFEAVIHQVELGTYRPAIHGLHAALRRFEEHAEADSVAGLLWYWRLQESEGLVWHRDELDVRCRVPRRG